ncbi:hypothetical protein ACH47C_39920 [Streptomyces rishiriensis]
MDVALVDVRMPRMDGFTARRQGARQPHPDRTGRHRPRPGRPPGP